MQELRARGLVPEVVEEETESATPGEVIKQPPSAGTELEPGSTVAIVVAKGQAKVEGAGRWSAPNGGPRSKKSAPAGSSPVVEEEEIRERSEDRAGDPPDRRAAAKKLIENQEVSWSSASAPRRCQRKKWRTRKAEELEEAETKESGQ